MDSEPASNLQRTPARHANLNEMFEQTESADPLVLDNMPKGKYTKNSPVAGRNGLSQMSKECQKRADFTVTYPNIDFARNLNDKPLGPLKSGMPADVLIPAPVIATTCPFSVKSSARAATFSSILSSSSNFSFIPHFPLCSYGESPDA